PRADERLHRPDFRRARGPAEARAPGGRPAAGPHLRPRLALTTGLEGLASPGQRQLGAKVFAQALAARAAHRGSAGVDPGPVGKLAALGQRGVLKVEKAGRDHQGRPVAGARAPDVPQGNKIAAVLEALNSHSKSKS